MAHIRRIDRGLDQIRRELKTRLVAKVGFPHEKNPIHQEARVKVAELAFIHEYGSQAQGIPSRPFMRLTGKREKAKVKLLLRSVTKLILRGALTKRQAMGRVGIFYAAEMQETIAHHGRVVLQANSPATIARKGSSAPLIDTGTMKNSITSVVTTPEAVRR